jgi:N-acylneuraminate cytidylyltransferase
MAISIIPARGGSKGIPKKNVIPFLGQPLISYTIHQSQQSQLIDQTYVSTDNKHIAEVSREAGANIIERPDELALDTSSTEEALLHALEAIEESPDIIVLLQCTSPLRRPNDIDNTILLVRDEEYNSALSCCEDHSFYWQYEDRSAEPINYDPSERKRRQEIEQWYQENGSIYVTERDILKKEKSRLGGKVGVHEMPKEMSFEIDTPEDYRIVEAIGKNIEFAEKKH